MVISAIAAAVNLIYQITLLAALGASDVLDTFFLFRSLPFFLEQLANNYFIMVVFPGLVFSPAPLGTSLAKLARDRFVRVVVASYAVLLVVPLLFFPLFGGRYAGAAVDPFVPRLVVIASLTLVLNMFIVAWFNSRHQYLTGICGSLINVSTMLVVLVVLRPGLTMKGVTWSLLAGAIAQLCWLIARYVCGRSTHAGASTGDTRQGGTPHAIAMSALGSASSLMDRVATSWQTAGNVSIMKIGRQVIETVTNVVFGALTASSFTLQCEERRDEKAPESLLLGDCRVVAVLAGLLIVGLLSGFGRNVFALVFAHGRFGVDQTATFHLCVAWLSPLMLLIPVRHLLTYRFFSQRQYTLPLMAAGAGFAADAILKLSLLGLGLRGVAAANAIAVGLHVAILGATLPADVRARLMGVGVRFVVLVAASVFAAQSIDSLQPNAFGVPGLTVACAMFWVVTWALFRSTARQGMEALRMLLHRESQ